MDSEIITWIVLISGLLYPIIMFAYRKATSGEAFDKNKFATTVGYGAMLAISAFIATGIFPESATIVTQLEAGIPDAPEIMTLGMTILIGLLHQYFKTSTAVEAATTTGTETAQSTPAATPTTDANYAPGFTVAIVDAPTQVDQIAVKSGNPVTVKVTTMSATSAISDVAIDWKDDTPVTHIGSGTQQATHTYTYAKGESKYTGHTFYPLFTITNVYGQTKQFNTAETGRSCAIEVQSQ